VRDPTAKRFFVQQLDLSLPPLADGRKTWDYYDSFEDALAALDTAIAGFAASERSLIRQEITDIEAVNATWMRQGDGPWSLVDPLR
jgi:hypothetical protein